MKDIKGRYVGDLAPNNNMKDYTKELEEIFRMRVLKIILFTTLLLILGTSVWAQGNQLCIPHEEAKKKLSDDFQENRAWVGMLQNGEGLVELYVNRETNTWTILTTRTQGTSCIASAGSPFFFENPSDLGLPASLSN